MSARIALDILDQLTADLDVGSKNTPRARTCHCKWQDRCSHGKGNQSALALDQIEDYFLDFFPELQLSAGQERQFALLWFVRFFRTYLTCLHDHFGLDVMWEEFDPRCGTPEGQLDSIESVIKLTKRICLSPMTDLLRKKPQPRVNCYPITSTARRMLKQRLLKVTQRSLQFSNSVLQMKRVCPKVPRSFVKSQLIAASDRLQLPCRQSVQFIDIIEDEVKRLVREYRFKPWAPKPTDPIIDVSRKATIESDREHGGGYGWYFNGLSLQDDYDNAGNYRPFVRVFETGPDRILSYYRRIDLTVKNCIDELKEILSQGFPERNLVGITEPLKVRVITTHHAVEPALWSGYQKHMAAENRNVPQILSGKSEFIDGSWNDFPIDIREIFIEAMEFYEAQNREWVLVSADATAATDSIHPLTTLAGSACSISNEYTEDIDWIFRNTFTGVYDDPRKSKIEAFLSDPLLQLNGQAMGDRRSFGLLCRIHYAMNRRFCRRYRLPLSFAINGDDGLFLLPQDLVETYFEFCDELWEVNILKTYVAKHIFSFNSTFYRFPEFEKVGIVRYSLMRGVDKFGERGQDPRVFNAVLDSNRVLSENRLFIEFQRYWRSRLDKMTRGGNNYFLPLCCGGLGLRPPRDRVWTTTRQQRFGILMADRKLERGVSQLETRTVGTAALPMTTILNGCPVRTTAPKDGREPMTTPSQLKVDNFEGVRLVPPILNGAVDYIPFEEETIERLSGTSRKIQPFF